MHKLLSKSKSHPLLLFFYAKNFYAKNQTGGQTKQMTDKKKISILERLLDERDAQIRELQQQNAELEEMIDSYHNTDQDIEELKTCIEDARKINAEYKKAACDYMRMKNDFRRKMKRFMLRNRVL